MNFHDLSLNLQDFVGICWYLDVFSTKTSWLIVDTRHQFDSGLAERHKSTIKAKKQQVGIHCHGIEGHFPATSRLHDHKHFVTCPTKHLEQFDMLLGSHLWSYESMSELISLIISYYHVQYLRKHYYIFLCSIVQHCAYYTSLSSVCPSEGCHCIDWSAPGLGDGTNLNT